MKKKTTDQPLNESAGITPEQAKTIAEELEKTTIEDATKKKATPEQAIFPIESEFGGEDYGVIAINKSPSNSLWTNLLHAGAATLKIKTRIVAEGEAENATKHTEEIVAFQIISTKAEGDR